MSGGITGTNIEINAGTSSVQNRIFTGIVRNVTISPNRDDPEYVILNVSGNDVLSRLNGKKFTRRCRSSKGVWVSIDNISRQGLRSGKLTYVPSEQNVFINGGDLYQEKALTTARTPSQKSGAETMGNQYVEEEVVVEVATSTVAQQ